MEWSERAQQMMKTWAETQQRMWSSWVDSMREMGANPKADLWEKTIDTWEQSVDRTLEAQSEWVQNWADGVKQVEGTPEQVVAWAADGREMMQRWQDAQRQLWHQWFEVLRKGAPGAAMFSGSEGERVMQSWQNAARKALETQMQWSSAWAQEGASAGGARGQRKTGGGSAKKSESGG